MPQPVNVHHAARGLGRVGLIIIGVIGITRGIAYLPGINSERLPGGIVLVTTYVPIVAWVVLWFAGGTVALISAIMVRPLGTVIVTFMCLIWGVGYLVSFGLSVWAWTMGVTPDPALPGPLPNRDWVGGALYIGVAGLLITGARLAVLGNALARKFNGYDEDAA